MKFFKPARKSVTLTLKVPSGELFDPMIIQPHNEINGKIFSQIDRITRRGYLNTNLTIAIFTDRTSPLIREKFIELFIEHYEDDLRTVRNALNRRYLQIFVFILLSIINIAVWNQLKGKILLGVLQNIWAFMIWKIGDTFLEGVQKWHNYRRIENLKKAKIKFYQIKNRNASAAQGHQTNHHRQEETT